MAESEVATYVLAYLLRGQYENTAKAFLQECTSLPSRSLLVLPEASLQTIISEYKTHKDTRVLVNTLGPESAWTALWEKVEQNLTQLKQLSTELVSSKTLTTHKGSGGRGLRAHRTRNTLRPHASTVQQPPPTPPTHAHSSSTATTSKPPTSQLHPSHPPTPHPSHPSTSTLPSPRKRKSVPPRRKAPPTIVAPTEPSDGDHLSEAIPDMQNILEAMLCNVNLPGKLADIINTVAGRDDGVEAGDIVGGAEEDGVELSPGTLESILNVACAEPAFEGLLGLPEPPPASEGTANRPIEIRIIPSHHQPPCPEDGYEPPEKRLRLSRSARSEVDDSLPPEMDIESFLDQLHS